MRVTGVIPENIRRCLPKEERTTKETITQAEADEIFDAREEKDLQDDIRQFLRLRLVPLIIQAPFGKKPTTPKGSPDFMILYFGQFVGLEVKVGSNKETEDQKQFGELIKLGGGIYSVVRSLSEVKAILDAIESKYKETSK